MYYHKGVSMNNIRFKEIMNEKIKEFLKYGQECGFFNQNNAKRVKERLQRIAFVQNNEIPGDAHTGMNSGTTTITINMNRTFFKEDWFADEVLFHELIHSVSGLYENEFETYYSWYIDKNIQKYMTEQEKEEFKVYSKEKPFEYAAGYGVALLDDFVAQYMAQKIVEKKYENDSRYKDGIYKRKLQNKRNYMPEYSFYSEFNDYPIYEEFGKRFVKALYGKDDIQRFCIESMNPDIVDNIILNYKNRKGGIESIYKLFTYLGTVNFAENVALNHYSKGTLTQDPNKVTQNPSEMKKIIGRLDVLLKYEIDRAEIMNKFGILH